MCKLVLVVVLLAVFIYGNPLDFGHAESQSYVGFIPKHESPKHQEYEPSSYPKYQFEYGVKDTHTGDIKEQTEERDGDSVKGEYTMVEPDGTIRKVQYHDDGKSGFNAIVTRSGHAQHPPTKLANADKNSFHYVK